MLPFTLTSALELITTVEALVDERFSTRSGLGRSASGFDYLRVVPVEPVATTFKIRENQLKLTWSFLVATFERCSPIMSRLLLLLWFRHGQYSIWWSTLHSTSWYSLLLMLLLTWHIKFIICIAWHCVKTLIHLVLWLLWLGVILLPLLLWCILIRPRHTDSERVSSCVVDNTLRLLRVCGESLLLLWVVSLTPCNRVTFHYYSETNN